MIIEEKDLKKRKKSISSGMGSKPATSKLKSDLRVLPTRYNAEAYVPI